MKSNLSRMQAYHYGDYNGDYIQGVVLAIGIIPKATTIRESR